MKPSWQSYCSLCRRCRRLGDTKRCICSYYPLREL
nr:MAG TPA: hypothetical protein [Caudoviricetes sp.]